MPRALSDKEFAAFRQKLCKVAASLFIGNGEKGVTMRELAVALGVSAMTPYRYFRNKEEILAAIRAQAYEQLADALEVAATASLTAEAERIQALCQAYVDFALENPSRYKLMIDHAQHNENDYPELKIAIDRCNVWLTSYAQGLVDTGVFCGNPQLIAYSFWANLHGVVSLQLAGRITKDCDMNEVVAMAYRALIAAFAPSNPKAA